MQINIEDNGDHCALVETSPSLSNRFPVPLAKPTLLDGLRAILSDPEAKEHIVGSVMITKNATGVKVAVGSGAFAIPHVHVFPMLAR